jgi:putative transposase
LETFLATSDGVLVKPPKFLKQMQGKLKLLQRRLSRKQKRSKTYEKQRLKVARMHHAIDNTRKDFHFKQAHALCDAADMVFMDRGVCLLETRQVLCDGECPWHLSGVS